MAGRPSKTLPPEPGTLAHRFKGAREANGLTVSSAAKKIGIKVSSLSEIEHGHTRKLKAETLAAAARVYHRSAEFLRTGHGSPVHVTADTPEESQLIEAYRLLDEAGRRYLIGAARGILAADPGPPSAAQPFRSKHSS